MDDTAAESLLVDEREFGARVGRQCRVAPTEDDPPDEQREFVDQPGDERLCCEIRATDQGRVPRTSKWRSSRVFAVVGAARVEE